MDESKRDENISYILRYCLYEEPYHMLTKAVLDEGLFKDARELLEVLLELHGGRHVRIEKSDHDNFRQVEVLRLSQDDVSRYLNQAEPYRFEEFPDEEYYVTTTETGEALLDVLMEGKPEAE